MTAAYGIDVGLCYNEDHSIRSRSGASTPFGMTPRLEVVMYPQHTIPQTKICSRCKRELPLDAFSIRRDRKIGYQSRCKECVGENSRLWYVANRDRRLSADRAWRKANPDKTRAYVRKSNAKHREKRSAYMQKYAEANRKAMNARSLIGNHVHRGKMLPASIHFCFVCGVSADMGASLYYHHVDYDKPLEVFPVCGSCHKLLHAGEAANG